MQALQKFLAVWVTNAGPIPIDIERCYNRQPSIPKSAADGKTCDNIVSYTDVQIVTRREQPGVEFGHLYQTFVGTIDEDSAIDIITFVACTIFGTVKLPCFSFANKLFRWHVRKTSKVCVGVLQYWIRQTHPVDCLFYVRKYKIVVDVF